MELWGWLIVPVAYLLGSIPFGLVIARGMGIGDLRSRGSGNIGATNVLRNAGKAAGAATLLLDMAKGAVPVLVARIGLAMAPEMVTATVYAAFLGHLFPIYLRFRGGKGVATGLGVALAWNPLAGIGAVLTWLLSAWLFGRSSLAALIAFALWPLFLLLAGEGEMGWLALPISLLIVLRHTENIKRLLAGTEPRIGNKG